MIQGRADALVVLIQRQEELRKHVHLVEGFRGQADELKTAAARLEPLLSVWRLFKARTIGNASTLPDATSLLKQVEELHLRYSETPAYVLGANRLSAIKIGLPAFAGTLEQNLLSSWQAYAATHVPNVNLEVLRVLGKISALRPRVEQVIKGVEELQAWARRLPASDTDIGAFEQRATEVNAAWTSLDSSQVPADVLSFLRDAGGLLGADLNKLTEPVLQWLREQNLTGAFRVRQTQT